MSFSKQIESSIQEKILSNQLDKEGALLEVACKYLQYESVVSEISHSYYYDNNDGKTIKINGFSLDDSEEILSFFINCFCFSIFKD